MKKRAGAAALLRFAAPSLRGSEGGRVQGTLHGGATTRPGKPPERLPPLSARLDPERAAGGGRAERETSQP